MSDLRALILDVLREGDAFGLEVIRRVNARAGRAVLGQHNAYPMLRCLEEEGALESYERDGPPERQGRPRRYYRLYDPRPITFLAFDSQERIATKGRVDLFASPHVAIEWRPYASYMRVDGPDGSADFVVAGLPAFGTRIAKGETIQLRVYNRGDYPARFLREYACVVAEPPAVRVASPRRRQA